MYLMILTTLGIVRRGYEMRNYGFALKVIKFPYIRTLLFVLAFLQEYDNPPGFECCN